MNSDRDSRFRRIFSWWRSERGGYAVLATYILGLPMLLIAFGYGLDSMRLSYFRNYLTNQAEQAAAAGASITHTKDVGTGGTSTVTIGKPTDSEVGQTALKTAYDIYIDNTASKRGAKPLSCATLEFVPVYPERSAPSTGEIDWRMRRLMENPGYKDTCKFASQVVGRPIPGIDLCSSNTDTRPSYGLVVGVNEQVTMTFLQIAGVKHQWLNNIRGTALIRAADTC